MNAITTIREVMTKAAEGDDPWLLSAGTIDLSPSRRPEPSHLDSTANWPTRSLIPCVSGWRRSRCENVAGSIRAVAGSPGSPGLVRYRPHSECFGRHTEPDNHWTARLEPGRACQPQSRRVRSNASIDACRVVTLRAVSICVAGLTACQIGATQPCPILGAEWERRDAVRCGKKQSACAAR